jgi:hypothetical protein
MADAGLSGGTVDVTAGEVAAPDLAVDRSALDRAPDRVLDATAPIETMRATDASVRLDSARDAPAPTRNVLLVVGDSLVPTEGDASLRVILVAMGLNVEVADDSEVADVNGIDLVLVAASCLSTNLADRYLALPIPILSTEPAIFDDLGMTGPLEGIDWQETDGTLVNIVQASHPMAAGLSGNIAVVSALATLTWGRPAATAVRVANYEGDPERAAIFGYPRLAQMVVGQAPARRVGFFAADLAAASLTDQGIALLRAAINWALTR